MTYWLPVKQAIPADSDSHLLQFSEGNMAVGYYCHKHKQWEPDSLYIRHGGCIWFKEQPVYWSYLPHPQNKPKVFP